MENIKLILISILFMVSSCYHKQHKTEVKECKIVSVEKVSRSTIEIEPYYKITTSCGLVFMDKDRYKVGDTIFIENRF